MSRHLSARLFRSVFLAGLITLVSGTLGAEVLTLDSAVEQALRVNVDYLNAQLSVDRAKNSLPSLVNWKAVSLSASQKQGSSSPGASGSPGTSTTSLGLSLPLFDQIGASASVDLESNTQISVTANPLAHSDTAAQAQIAVEKAVLTAAQARITLENTVRKAYLALVLAQSQLQVQQKRTALKETAYLDAKARYAKGKVTLAEVRTALQDWTQARSTQTSLERNLVKARSDLSGRIQADAVEVPALDLSLVEGLVRSLGAVDPEIKGISTAVRTQSLEVEAQKAKAQAVWLFDPGLSVSGSASLPAKGSLSWSGAVTLTLALGDWQGAEKALAERSLALSQQALEAQKANARSTETQALLSVQAAQGTLETRGLALSQAQELLTQTNLLLTAGQATSLDGEDAALGVAAAQNDLFAAWADLYGALLDLTAARS